MQCQQRTKNINAEQKELLLLYQFTFHWKNKLSFMFNITAMQFNQTLLYKFLTIARENKCNINIKVHH